MHMNWQFPTLGEGFVKSWKVLCEVLVVTGREDEPLVSWPTAYYFFKHFK